MEKYVIYRHIGNLSELNNGRIKELNLISWNDREPVYDIRTWNEEHTKYGKGVSLTPKQMAVLKEILDEITVF
ncbi:MAG: PC4/YdbC family ssDNA-binding protein [Roseburia sp.]|nr:PC4/YdbC family ssDNA-binding protein [Roseburia sp.]